MCLFDELFCFCLVDARKMHVKLDRELKFIVELAECDMARYLDITELLVLLVGHKTNRTGETCRVAGRKQLLRIRCTRFAWSTHFTRYTQIELHNAIRAFNVTVSSPSGGRNGRIQRLVCHSFSYVDVFCSDQKSRERVDIRLPKTSCIWCDRFPARFANAPRWG
jgi:hypothetical protein